MGFSMADANVKMSESADDRYVLLIFLADF